VKYKAIVFDFDGVILERVEVKGWAFGELFKDYPQEVERIIDYHHQNGGVSRFEKVRYIFKEYLQQELTEDHFEQLCSQYSKIVVEKVLACDFVPGAVEFISSYAKQIPLFIVSGTPTEEMRMIASRLELDHYFRGIYGSPTTKGDWVKRILDDWNLASDEVIIVGDSLSDAQAAHQHAIPFIGRVTDKNRGMLTKESAHAYIADMTELEGCL